MYCQAQPQLNSTSTQLKLRLRLALFPSDPATWQPANPPDHPELGTTHIKLVFINILATKYWIFKSFFLLKTEINTQILNTKPFMCDIRGPRYSQYKIWFSNRSINFHSVSYWPQNRKICVKLQQMVQDSSDSSQVAPSTPSNPNWLNKYYNCFYLNHFQNVWEF